MNAIALVTFSTAIQPNQANPTYLVLYSQMIQGILEYEVRPIIDHFMHILIFCRPAMLDGYLRNLSLNCPFLVIAQWLGPWTMRYSVGSWRLQISIFWCQWQSSTWRPCLLSSTLWLLRDPMALYCNRSILDQSTTTKISTRAKRFLMNGGIKLTSTLQLCVFFLDLSCIISLWHSDLSFQAVKDCANSDVKSSRDNGIKGDIQVGQ